MTVVNPGSGSSLPAPNPFSELRGSISGSSWIVIDETTRINVKADFGAKGDGSTDDTTAIQNALVAAGQSSNPHVQIEFPDTNGEDYVVAGAIQTTDPYSGAGNYAAQLCIPYVAAGASTPRKILELVGSGYRGLSFGGGELTPGPRIRSTITGVTQSGSQQNPCVIGGPDGSNGGSYTNLLLRFAGLMGRVPSNPTVAFLNGMRISSLVCEDFTIDTTDGPSPPGSAPTHVWAVGVLFPGSGNNADCLARNGVVASMYGGIAFHEHFEGDAVSIIYCVGATGPHTHESATGRGASYKDLTIENCTYFIAPLAYDSGVSTFPGVLPVKCDFLKIEDAAGGHWYSTTAHVADNSGDSTGLSTGVVEATRTTAGLGANPAPLIRIGAARWAIKNLTQAGIQLVNGGVGYKNSWADNSLSSPSWQQPGWYMDRSGMVHLVGVLGGTGAAGTVAFTLPAGARPLIRTLLGLYGGGTSGFATVDPNGDVTPNIYGGATSPSFLGDGFFAAQ